MIILKDIIDEDFINYKKCAMTLIFPYCDFKCDKECGKQVCQNSSLTKMKNIQIPIESIYERYINNDLSEAIVCQGLEPFDSWEDLLKIVQFFRIDKKCFHEIVIYSGFQRCQIADKIQVLSSYQNVIVKFGRFIPDQKSHYDDVLGVELASPNQYAEKIS